MRHQHIVLDAVHLHPVARRGRVEPRRDPQPVLHHRDLIALLDHHAFAENRDVLAGAVRGRPAGHDHGLRVVRIIPAMKSTSASVWKPPEARRRGVQPDAGACAQPRGGLGTRRSRL
jgi:hypothetical protein